MLSRNKCAFCSVMIGNGYDTEIRMIADVLDYHFWTRRTVAIGGMNMGVGLAVNLVFFHMRAPCFNMCQLLLHSVPDQQKASNIAVPRGPRGFSSSCFDYPFIGH